MVAAAWLIVLSCSDLTGPGELVAPELQELVIGEVSTRLQHGGMIYIYGYPADTAFRLERRQRVPVDVEVSSGDHERAGLFRQWCPARSPTWGYHCFQFMLGMRDGYLPQSLAELVAAAGGRFLIYSDWFAAVTLFDPENLVHRAREARSWPGVAFTELSYPGACVGDEVCVLSSDLLIPLPVDTGDAVPDDGIVQVRSRDTVTVSYRQSGRRPLVTRRIVP